MSGTTWTKFYWSDWESDPALRLCSLAAQGLWMRMLCIASAHDPIGYVAVAGRGLDETALARMTGCSGSEVSDLLGELDRNGVFSRDRNGRIFSRRMVSDAKRAAIARKNGKMGGNPSLGKGEGKTGWDNPPDKPRLKTQEPTTTNQKERQEPTVPCPAKPDGDAFSKAWMTYPPKRRERSKTQAKTRPVWREAARAAGGEARLLDAVARYVREDQTHKGECGPPAFDKWLRDGRWEHWLPGGSGGSVSSPAPAAFNGPAALRQHVVAVLGEDFAAGWIDPCTWREDGRALICRNAFVRDKLARELGPRLAKWRVQLEVAPANANDPRPAEGMAA